MTSTPEVTDDTLRRAILDGLVTYKVQPILDARTCRLTAGEILARWQAPDVVGEELLTTEDYLKKLCLLEWEEPFQSELWLQKRTITTALRGEAHAQTYVNFVPEVLLDDNLWTNVRSIV